MEEELTLRENGRQNNLNWSDTESYDNRLPAYTHVQKQVNS